MWTEVDLKTRLSANRKNVQFFWFWYETDKKNPNPNKYISCGPGSCLAYETTWCIIDIRVSFIADMQTAALQLI